jgi:hypothetical protein
MDIIVLNVTQPQRAIIIKWLSKNKIRRQKGNNSSVGFFLINGGYAAEKNSFERCDLFFDVRATSEHQKINRIAQKVLFRHQRRRFCT